MIGRRRAMALLLLVAALVLALLGQIYFFRHREYLWDGLIFHVLAMLCFLLAWRLAGRQPAIRPGRRSPRLVAAWIGEQPVPAALMSLGLFSALVAALLARERTAYQSAADVMAFWSLGLAAVAATAFWPSPAPRFPIRTANHAKVPEDGPQNDTSRRLTRRLPLRPFVDRLSSSGLGRLPPGQRDVWLEVVAVGALTVLALVLRVVALDRIPYTLGGDEAWHGLLARQVLRGELRNPFSMGYMSMPTFFYWPLSLSLWLVGDSVMGLRLPAALVGAATVPLLYVLVRRLWGWRTAVLAAAVLAAYDYHIHFSRLGGNNVWDPFLTVLVLWLLDRACVDSQTNGLAARAATLRRKSFVLAGLVMGLSVLFYTGARLLPWLVLAYLTFIYAKRRLQRRAVPSDLGWLLLLLVLAFLIAAAPMLSYALAHPGEWNARVNHVGIIQSGWLEREPGLTGKSTVEILAEQFLRAAGAFHAFPDRTVWYGADRPLLGFMAGLLAMFGLAWAVAHWRERRHFLVLVWFWAVIIAGGMLTESPPSSQRLVMAIPPVVLLVVIGLEKALDLLWRLFLPRLPGAKDTSPPEPSPPYKDVLRRSQQHQGASLWPFLPFRLPQAQSCVLALFTLALTLSSVRYYFVEFTPMRRYGSENGETATMMGHYLRDLGGDVQAYLLGAPRIYWSFGTMAFLAPETSGQDIVDPLNAPPSLEIWGHPAVFLLLPERAGELHWVQQSFPGGREQEFRDRSGRLRFIAYEIQSQKATPYPTSAVTRDPP